MSTKPDQAQFGAVVALVLTAPEPAAAQELVITNDGGGVACLTRSDLDDAYTAAREENMAWFRALQTPGRGTCITMKKGAFASLKERGFLSTIAQVNLHPPRDAVDQRPLIVHTSNENYRLATKTDRSEP